MSGDGRAEETMTGDDLGGDPPKERPVEGLSAEERAAGELAVVEEVPAEDSQKHEVDKASVYWNRQHFAADYLRGEWSHHPAAQARLNRVLGGLSREEWFWRRVLNGRSGLRALGVGVGRAATELRLLSTGTIAQYDLYDPASVALEAGAEVAAAMGLSDKANFICGDIRTATLEPESYDLVTFVASLHHFPDLDRVLEICKRALKPGGIVWTLEYVGPDYFDYPPEHARLAHDLWHGLDPALTKSWVPQLTLPSVAEVIAADPTESPASSQIIETMRRVLPATQVIPTYGSFAFIIFWGLNHDVIYDTEAGNRLAEAIMAIDTALIDSGALPHYFAYTISQKPGPGVAPMPPVPTAETIRGHLFVETRERPRR